MGDKRKKKSEAGHPRARPRGSEEQAAPPDSAGGQGSFSRPQDEMVIPGEAEVREGAPAPPLAEDTARGDPDARGAKPKAAP